MKAKHVLRHYCDHCGKGMFQKPAMIAHESRCFRNPAIMQTRKGRPGEEDYVWVDFNYKEELKAMQEDERTELSHELEPRF